MNKKKIDEALSNYTQGLRDDREIMLEIQSELRSHLDSKIEELQSRGVPEDKCIDQALKSFGPPVEIADGIEKVNAARMKLRARIKKFGMLLLIPAVIACAIFSLDLSTIFDIRNSFDQHGFPAIFDSPKDTKFFGLISKYTTEEKLILYGDRSRKLKWEQQKAIWEKFPDNKMYLANYILILLSEFRKKNPEKVLPELKLAQKLDPDNALYNYIAAGIYLEDACEQEPLQRKPGQKIFEYKLIITDKQKMDKAVDEYLAGTEKPFCRDYTLNLLQKRLKIIGPPKNVLENLQQIGISAGVMLPHMLYNRAISRNIWGYAAILAKQGKTNEAVRIVRPWKKYLTQLTGDSKFFIEVLIDLAIAENADKFVPEVYREAGKMELAAKTKTEINKIITIKSEWEEERKNFNFDCSRENFKKIAMLAGMMLPAIGKFDYTPEDFAISRKIEYIAIEKIALKILNIFLIICLLGAVFSTILWRIKSKQRAMLLLPDSTTFLRVFLYGLIVPITVYLLISESGILGGREYNIQANCAGLAAQLLILLFFIPVLTFKMSRKYVRNRCFTQNVDLPDNLPDMVVKVAFIGTCIILPVLAMFLVTPFKETAFIGISFFIMIFLLLVPSWGILAFYQIKTFLFSIFRGGKYAVYYGALAKTLIPMFALAIILLSVTVKPYLDWREANLISKDKLIYGSPKTFTRVENQVTTRLRKKILKALGEPENTVQATEYRD